MLLKIKNQQNGTCIEDHFNMLCTYLGNHHNQIDLVYQLRLWVPRLHRTLKINEKVAFNCKFLFMHDLHKSRFFRDSKFLEHLNQNLKQLQGCPA